MVVFKPFRTFIAIIAVFLSENIAKYFENKSTVERFTFCLMLLMCYSYIISLCDFISFTLVALLYFSKCTYTSIPGHCIFYNLPVLQEKPVDSFSRPVFCFWLLDLAYLYCIISWLLPSSFLTQNSSKLGTGMEVIFLSLSMSNLIRSLTKKWAESNCFGLLREEMNDLKLIFLSILASCERH
jgi:hypothetical protein